MPLRAPVLHSVRGEGGMLVATYAEEVPLSHVNPPSDAKAVWEAPAEVDDAWRRECGPRVAKVALPLMPTEPGTQSQAPPVLIDVYYTPAVKVKALDTSCAFESRVGMVYDQDVPPPPDFIVYCEDSTGSSAGTLNDPQLWSVSGWEDAYRRVTHRRHDSKPPSAAATAAASPSPKESSPGPSFRLRRRSASPPSVTSTGKGHPHQLVARAIAAAHTGSSTASGGDVEGDVGLDESLTAHGRRMDAHFHRAMAAFSLWASSVIRGRQAETAARIHNDRFSFEFAAALQPRIAAGAGSVAVDARGEWTTVYVRLNLFGDLASTTGRKFRQMLMDMSEFWTIARLRDGDVGDDDDRDDAELGSPSARQAATVASIICRLDFRYTMKTSEPTQLPSASRLIPRFHALQNVENTVAGSDDEGKAGSAHHHHHLGRPEPTASEIASMLQRRLDSNPVPPPGAGRNETLLDILPLMEEHVIDTVMNPVARWLRLVGAFRAVFGPTITDRALAPLTDTRCAQFMVLDGSGPEMLGVIVTVTWQVPVPLVTYTSAQHVLPTGGPMTFSWTPPAPAPSIDDPCSVAASAFSYLHENWHKLVRACEARGMLSTPGAIVVTDPRPPQAAVGGYR